MSAALTANIAPDRSRPVNSCDRAAPLFQKRSIVGERRLRSFSRLVSGTRWWPSLPQVALAHDWDTHLQIRWAPYYTVLHLGQDAPLSIPIDAVGCRCLDIRDPPSSPRWYCSIFFRSHHRNPLLQVVIISRSHSAARTSSRARWASQSWEQLGGRRMLRGKLVVLHPPCRGSRRFHRIHIVPWAARDVAI